MKLTLLENALLIVFLQLKSSQSSIYAGKHLTWTSVTESSLDLSSQEPSGYFQEQFTHVARAPYKYGKLCGQIHPKTKTFTSTFKGDEVSISGMNDDTKVLTYQPNTVSWIQRGVEGNYGDGDAEIPHNLILCGMMPGTGEHLFACRVEKGSSLIVGYFRLTTNTCVISFDGEESDETKFEVLVMNYFGIITNGAWPA